MHYVKSCRQSVLAKRISDDPATSAMGSRSRASDASYGRRFDPATTEGSVRRPQRRAAIDCVAAACVVPLAARRSTPVRRRNAVLAVRQHAPRQAAPIPGPPRRRSGAERCPALIDPAWSRTLGDRRTARRRQQSRRRDGRTGRHQPRGQHSGGQRAVPQAAKPIPHRAAISPRGGARHAR